MQTARKIGWKPKEFECKKELHFIHHKLLMNETVYFFQLIFGEKEIARKDKNFKENS